MKTHTCTKLAFQLLPTTRLVLLLSALTTSADLSQSNLAKWWPQASSWVYYYEQQTKANILILPRCLFNKLPAGVNRINHSLDQKWIWLWTLPDEKMTSCWCGDSKIINKMQVYIKVADLKRWIWEICYYLHFYIKVRWENQSVTLQ